MSSEDRIKNGDIVNIVGTSNIKYIERLKVMWFGLLMRVDLNQLPQKQVDR
uniref:Uncharacterized protein n=1 Tax=Arion vulgaris TaxID=1028688 RepID=A0A0B6YW69_9EUPU